jgi:hypothetical protein
MAWETLFGIANIWAMIWWAGLILAPRWPALLSGALFAGTGLLCLAYTVLLGLIVSGSVDPVGGSGGADFTTLAGVQAIFASQGGAVVGWVHYLAFDLFVGVWIARDADAKKFSRLLQAPILLATFLAGPLGLFVWLAIRERRARQAGRWQ